MDNSPANPFLSALSKQAHQTIDFVLHAARERGYRHGDVRRVEIGGIVSAHFTAYLRGDLEGEASVTVDFSNVGNAISVTYCLAHPVRGDVEARRFVFLRSDADEYERTMGHLAAAIAPLV